jgi:hypothetical protein
MNHIDKAIIQSQATEDAGLHLQGAHTVCPYPKGTPEREVYDRQWRRMMNLADMKGDHPQ